jgi:hypothetical protein
MSLVGMAAQQMDEIARLKESLEGIRQAVGALLESKDYMASRFSFDEWWESQLRERGLKTVIVAAALASVERIIGGHK